MPQYNKDCLDGQCTLYRGKLVANAVNDIKMFVMS